MEYNCVQGGDGVKQVIYIDVLLFLNTIITFLLLLAASKLIKITPGVTRIIIGSLIGGASSLIIFAPDMGLILSVLIKLLFSFVITSVTYKSSSIRAVVRHTGYFFAVSFIFAGIILFVASLPGLSVITYNNGAVYIDFSFFSLVAASSLCYVITVILNKITKHSKENDVLVNVEIRYGDKKVSSSAITDTGNSLVDPFTGESIIIADKFVLKSLLPSDIVQYFNGNIEMCGHIRLVPCSTVTADGLLPVFRADSIVLNSDSSVKNIEKPLIAVCDRKLSHIILPAGIIENKEGSITNEKTVG